MESKTTIVHLKKEKFDLRIDRFSIFGNPWTHKKGTRAHFLVMTREEAINNYRLWLLGEGHINVLQRERKLILDALPQLGGKCLGCWCKPLSCHGDVLVELIERNRQI